MNIIAPFITKMIASGFSVEDAIRAADVLEEVISAPAPMRNPEGFRTAKAQQQRPEERVWVYVIEVQHPGDVLVKVGISKHPELRLAALEKQRGYNLFLTHTEGPFSRRAARAFEAKAHDILASQREQGEWFLCGAERAVEVVQACVAGGVQ